MGSKSGPHVELEVKRGLTASTANPDLVFERASGLEAALGSLGAKAESTGARGSAWVPTGFSTPPRGSRQ